jgi:hypothetical protein
MTAAQHSSGTGPPTPTGLVFLTGCGRSGTTILGETLSRRADVAYLNDQFRLWTDPFPAADIWGLGAGADVGRIAMDDRDVTADGRRAVFARIEAARASAPVIIEKLAINNYRLPFLRALAPSARFINIVRHGVEVARSIEQKILAGEWYGAGDRKWRRLVEHAESVGLGDLAASCAAPLERGLLEWRMSVEAAQPTVTELDGRVLIQVTYEELVDFPGDVIARIERFLGLPESGEASRWAAGNIRRRSAPALDGPVPEGAERIAGHALRRFGYEL